MVDTMFAARTSDKRGKKRHHAFASNRDEAAQIVFRLDPKAKTCSTARAHMQADGHLWDTGNDMQWHNRPS